MVQFERTGWLLLGYCLLSALQLSGQGEGNLWLFGRDHWLDFGNGAPLPGRGMPAGSNNSAHGQAGAMCDAAGNLLFIVKMLDRSTVPYATASALPNVFDRNGDPMPQGNLLSEYGGQGVPYIVPHPGNPLRYYVFFVKGSGLYYSLIDMSLNNGLGDVMPGEKNILLENQGTVVGPKLTAIKGCNSVWIMVRSRVHNQYISYKLTSSGISPHPVVSEAGTLPLPFYYSEGSGAIAGLLKASPDGKRLAAACWSQGPGNIGGLELYDFESCSGQVINPLVIDTAAYYSVCFSPDNTKLYATSGRDLYQFDLNLPSTAAIRASKTLILTNPPVAIFNPILGCYCDTLYPLLRDLKRGPDDKIYLANNNPHRLPYGYPYMHVIHAPDLPGPACQPALNALQLTPAGFNAGGGEYYLPADIVRPPVQDTLYSRRSIAACFRDSLLLWADTPGNCYRWNNGTAGRKLAVYQPGDYIVSYTGKDCALHTDTFSVSFAVLPLMDPPSYSCPGQQRGHTVITAADKTICSYTWKDTSGKVLKTSVGTGDTLHGLNPGRYLVEIVSKEGCDTVLYTEVLPLPVPQASFEADTITCKNEPVRFHSTSDAPSWRWYFGDGTMAEAYAPEHTYRSPGDYRVILIAENIERCMDTAIKIIRVKDLKIDLIPDKQVADRQEPVILRTEGPEAYRVIAWMPGQLFADQQAYRQQIASDTTSTYMAVGISEYGCLDTAAATVLIHPVVHMPAAFTPNGDGRNDYFRPVIIGARVMIRSFRVFDRWGKLIWSDADNATGWDGTYQGTPAETGVYFYRIEMETYTGKTITKQGDVTLLR